MKRPTYEQESTFGVTGQVTAGLGFTRTMMKRTMIRLQNAYRKRRWREELMAKGLWLKGVKRNGSG